MCQNQICIRAHFCAILQGVQSTIKASLLWGLTPGQGATGQGIDNGPNLDGDPAGQPVDVRLTHDESWDPSDRIVQKQIFAQLDDLMDRDHLVLQLRNPITNNPLDTCATLLQHACSLPIFACSMERPVFLSPFLGVGSSYIGRFRLENCMNGGLYP